MAGKENTGIITLGYEGKNIEGFIQELQHNNVQILVDVRRNAFSRKTGFSKSRLTDNLKQAGIKYVHIPELGIESKRRKNLRNEEDYNRLLREYSDELLTKEKHLDLIMEMSEEKKIALMCFEKDIEQCHRSAIAKKLRKCGREVEDI